MRIEKVTGVVGKKVYTDGGDYFGEIEEVNLFENKIDGWRIRVGTHLMSVLGGARGVIFPKVVITNLTLFLSLALIVVFVATVLWGFLTGEGSLAVDGGKKFHKVLMWIFIIGLVLGIIWAFGVLSGFTIGLQKVFSFLFASSWSGGFWMNLIFVFLIVVAIAIAVDWNPFKGGSWFAKV
jgi:hypothetical protein